MKSLPDIRAALNCADASLQSEPGVLSTAGVVSALRWVLDEPGEGDDLRFGHGYHICIRRNVE
ncbi:MAG TPA: hypothetical protein VN939_15545 [Chthoniobacterales bacterium]|nr:hypothetical protein [Chthoniobacterales bacterium]